MRTAPPTESDRLAELLADLEREPVTLIDDLRAAREAAEDGDPRLAQELARAELEYLERRAGDPRASAPLRAAFADAARAAQRARERELAAAPEDDPAALFDLAELCAELRLAEDDAGVARVVGEFDARIQRVEVVSEAMRYEGGERYAALATEEEDRSVRHQVLLLRETRTLLERIDAKVGGDPLFARLARRLRRAECDRVLQLRMEALLTRRGTIALETTSLLLLVGLFVLLAIEASIGARRWIVIADASVCTYFIVEFAFKLTLAPARMSWFLRNALTDLLPAIPAALWFVAVVPGSELTPIARALRFLRIAWFARYVQALRPALRMFRLTLFLVRGSDALVRRFSGLLNRDFVFFERGVMPLVGEVRRDPRTLPIQALRREHVLLSDLPLARAEPLLVDRARALVGRFDALAGGVTYDVDRRADAVAGAREIPVEHAIEFLWRLQPSELVLWVPRQDLAALDRMVRVLNAPIVRLLPVVRSLRVERLASTADARVVAFGRKVAGLLERWRNRALHIADLHGIVSGPQVLDRIASGLIRVSQRPAVRLLLFGALFALVRWIVGADNLLGTFLARFVATPLVVLGGVCLVLLALGRWLKSLAGQASDALVLTSEAHFHGLVELVKRRTQDHDLEFLGRRVFADRLDPWIAAGTVASYIRSLRTAQPIATEVDDDMLDDAFHRVALLYLHFLDGAPLHENDVKTNEQLLANLSLENVRNAWLGWTKRDRRRLRRLAPGEGSLFRGPSVWFRFVTDSIAVETARRVTDYNRHCLTIEQCRFADAAERAAFARWLRRRRSPDADLLERAEEGTDRPAVYRTTEFHALDFLTIDPTREEHLARAFGRGVVALLRRDREHMIRELFGTRPLDKLPRERRTLNFYQFYEARLAGGRVFLMPLYALWLAATGVRMTVAKTVQVVREILAPERAIAHRERGRAPFAVALRKIHRMKAPVLIEAMHMRAAFDPAYVGAPLDWDAMAMDSGSDLERDLDFLGMRDRERADLEDVAATTRARVEELRQLVPEFEAELPSEEHAAEGSQMSRAGRRAVTIAYATDAGDLRTLLRARRWFEDTLPVMEDPATELPGYLPRRLVLWVLRGFRAHPVRRWLRDHHRGRKISRRGRSNFVRAWHAGDEELRRTIEAWSSLRDGVTPASAAYDRMRAVWRRAREADRELVAVRTVQSLSVLDVHNYRRIVFELGGFARDGEDPAQGGLLP